MNKNIRWSATVILILGFLITSTLSPLKSNASTPFNSRNINSYDDFDQKAFWANAMQYFVVGGEINTYTIHPRTKQKGHWLNPTGGLTEGQFLYLLTKHDYLLEYKQTKATSGVSYSVAYKIADKHKLTTKATHSKNRSYASQTMTRGQYAQILASAHYGKKVDLKTAVAFMYKSKITQGDKGKNGKYAQTYDSFGVNTKVSRAYGVYMLKNYSTFKASAHPASVSSIKTLYGGHTYGSRNQAEYDAVIGVAKKVLQGVNEKPFAQNADVERAYMDYFDGAKPILDRASPNYRTDYNMALLYAQSELTFYKESGMSKSDIIKYWQIKGVFSKMDTGVDPEDGSPSSAYDALFRGVTDCDADSQVLTMLLDMMGYNVAILGRPGHAFTAVKLGGAWRNATTFDKITMSNHINGVGGERVIVQPTKGY